MPSARPWLRLVLAISVDGRLAPPQAGAAQLGGAPDRQVLEQALCWADACLIGAETLRRHGSTCLIHAPALLARRRQAGLAPQPVAIVVSGGGALPADLPFFGQPLQRWRLTLPPLAEASPGRQPEPGAASFERDLQAPHWPAALTALARCGVQRLVVLGGARLAGSLLMADRLDELQLTVCPMLLGGPHSWLPLEALPALGQRHWRLLEARQIGAGELLLRYRRDGARLPPAGSGAAQGDGVVRESGAGLMEE